METSVSLGLTTVRFCIDLESLLASLLVLSAYPLIVLEMIVYLGEVRATPITEALAAALPSDEVSTVASCTLDG